MERLRRRPARPRRRGGGGRSPLRLLRHPRVAAVRERHAGQHAMPSRGSRATAWSRGTAGERSTSASIRPTRRPIRPRQEPQLPEPAHPGVVPGYRPDQLPAVVFAPGADARLLAAARRQQHRHQLHQHQPGVWLRPRLRQDHHVRVRHPARLQRRHGAGRGGVQQGHRLRSGGPPGQPVRPGTQPRQRFPRSSPTSTSATSAGSTCGSTGGSATTSTARCRTPSSRPRTPGPIRSPTSTTARAS